MTVKDIKKYKDINDSFSKEFIYHLGCEAGFFSEYNNMILAMLYCLKNHIRFSVYSKDANFSYSNGWNDYFKSFCEEKGNLLHRWFNKRPNPRFKNSCLRKIDQFLSDSFRSCNKDCLTLSNLWNDIRSLDIHTCNIPELGINGCLQDACRKMIQYTWHYNAQTNQIVSDYISSLNLPSHYIGFHIRGGDKFVEAQLQNVDVYINKAQSLSILRKAFVLTDDYSIIELLEKNYPEWTFYTLCKPNERGYFHQKFKKQSKELIKHQHIKLFASVDVLASSDLFIGTFSSNPGMYLGMRMDVDKTYSVDVPNWTIW